MTDVVERLCQMAAAPYYATARHELRTAADEITRLRRQVADERASTIEECAKVADEFVGEFPARDRIVGRIIGHNIRALGRT